MLGEERILGAEVLGGELAAAVHCVDRGRVLTVVLRRALGVEEGLRQALDARCVANELVQAAAVLQKVRRGRRLEALAEGALRQRRVRVDDAGPKVEQARAHGREDAGADVEVDASIRFRAPKSGGALGRAALGVAVAAPSRPPERGSDRRRASAATRALDEHALPRAAAHTVAALPGRSAEDAPRAPRVVHMVSKPRRASVATSVHRLGRARQRFTQSSLLRVLPLLLVTPRSSDERNAPDARRVKSSEPPPLERATADYGGVLYHSS